ncbi:MAG: hypothetical protein WBH03_17320 [Cyclobacteriaceae bacterium]
MEDANREEEEAEFTGFDQGDVGNHGAVNKSYCRGYQKPATQRLRR